MIPLTDDCDDCVPGHVPHAFGIKAAFSTIPFAATFCLLTYLAYRKVYPLLSAVRSAKGQNGGKDDGSFSVVEPPTQLLARRIAAITFSSTIALSAVLTELLLCEISNSFNPTARSVALQFTVASLLGLLVVAIPLLGISSVVSKSGYKFDGESRNRVRLAWALEFAGYGIFLVGFWTIGSLLPHERSIKETIQGKQGLFQACLDRLGITGVSLMALLSGFASVSSIWQNFGPKPKLVAEADITRKQAGLDATIDMIAEKKERLHQLQKKMSNAPTQSLWSKTVTSLRGNADSQEKQTLELEISGLETMSASLDTSVSVLRTRRHTQLRSSTPLGKLHLAFSYTFSLYCIYRIITTLINIARRLFSPHSSTPIHLPENPTDTDPVTSTIALIAKTLYPALDQASWAHQISFLLSGAMLLASFSAVTQTFHLFSRFLPPTSTSILQPTRTNFALLISQISGMYVISSALMLRGMMPASVGSVIEGALGGSGSGLMEPAWVQRWFDGCFIVAVLVTAVGIWAGKQIGGAGAWDDEGWDSLGEMEMGKRS